MAKLDLKDAYLQVPIHPDHHQFLQFQWEGKTYQFKCLPFGLSAAPRVFTKLLKPVVGLLRQIGVRMIIYLEDILLLHQSLDLLEILVSQVVCQLFEALGLLINRKKSLLAPTQQIEFLGFQICYLTLRIQTPSEKLRKIRQDALRLLSQTTVSMRELARFVGKTSATTRAIQAAPLHYRALQRLMNSALPPDTPHLAVEKFRTQVELSPAARMDLT